MKTTRKILLALVLTLAVAAVMSVCAFAFDINTDLPQGVTNESDKWIPSGYTDVDTEEGWYLIARNEYDYSATDGNFPTFATMNSTRFYWNKTTGEAVWLAVGSNLSGDSGEETVYSKKNPSNTAKLKYYAYASCFVDVTNTTDNTFKTGFASGKTEIEQYVTQNATKYPIYNSYITAGTASTQWSNVYVTKDAYDAFVKYKKSLGYEAEDAKVTDTEHQKLLVEWAYENISTYKNLRNCQEDGAAYRMAWVFDQLATNGYVFKSIEIRAAKGVTPYFGTVGLVTKLIEVEKVLFDSRIVQMAFTNTTRGLFPYIKNLDTLAHVEYVTDEEGNYTGEYSTDVADGVVDLSGFTSATPYTVSSADYVFGQMLCESTAIKNVVYFNSIAASYNTAKYEYTFANGAQLAGYVDMDAFKKCTALKTFTMTAPLTAICQNAFYGCSALTTIDLKGGVAAGATVASDAFTNATQNITVYVYTALDEAKANALFAGFENITVVNKSPLKNPVISEGFQIRVHDYSGLRSIFTLDASVVAENAGYTLSDYGVITFSEATLLDENLFNNNLGALLIDALSETPTYPGKTIRTSVMTANRFVEVFDADETVEDQMYADEVGDKTFCITLTNIPDKNVMNAVYSVAYTVWEGADGTDYTFTIYASENEDTLGKSAFSLYDVTIGMFVNGVINTQTVTDDEGKVWQCCLWDVLDNGALSVTASDVTTPNANLTVGYAFTDEDGDETTAATFTYANKPLRAWKMCRVSDGAFQLQNTTSWNSIGHYVEGDDTNTTNVVWSLLKYNDSLIAVYRRDPDATEGEVATIPSLRGDLAAPAPFDASYFTYSKIVDSTGLLVDGSSTTVTAGLLGGATVYTPILSAANEAKITTLVIDHGVNSLAIRPFDFATVDTLDTIVYPEGVSGGGQIFQGCKKVSTVIFASDSKASLTAATQVEGFGNIVDLSGLVTLGSSNFAFSGCEVMENIILPKTMNWNSGAQEIFNNCSKLKRVWTIGQDAPDAGVVDLSMVTQGVLGFCKNALTKIPAGTTFILPSSFRGVSSSAYKLSEATPSSQAFGVDTAYTFDLGSNIGALYYNTTTEDYGILQYYDKLKSLGSSDARYDNIDKITVVCDVEEEGVMVEKSMTIAEWRTYCVAQGLYTPAS